MNPRDAGWGPDLWARATFTTALACALPVASVMLWFGGLVEHPTVTGTVTATAMALFAVIPATGAVIALALATPGATRRRERVERVASLAALAAFAHYVFWLVRHGALSDAWQALAAAAVGIGLAEVYRRVLRGHLERVLFTGLRRRRGFRRVGALLVGAVASVALVVTASVVLPALLPPRASALLAEPRPTRRLVVVHLDGILRDDFTYWAALRSRSSLETLLSHGANASVAWRSRAPKDALRRLGTPSTEAPVPAHELPGFRAVVRAVWPLPGLEPLPAGAPPPLWSLAEHTGLGALIAGWERTAFEGRAPRLVIAPSDHTMLVEALAGDPAALDRSPDRALLRGLRELAQPPEDDWRRGARLTDREQEAIGRAAVLGVSPDGLWRDRFLIRSFVELLERDDCALGMLQLAFGRTLADAADPVSPDAPQDVRDAVVAYLDVLDDEIVALRRSLRAGDALVLLVTASVAGERPRPAPMVVFGEKARRGASVPDVFDADDLALTLYYLFGAKLPRRARGEIGWALLTEGLAEHLPPRFTARYGVPNP